MSLERENSTLFETLIDGFVDFVSRPFALLKPNLSHKSLNAMRVKNQFGVFAPTIIAIAGAIFTAAILLAVTTDDWDGAYVQHIFFEKLFVDPASGSTDLDAQKRAFVFFIRDASVIFLLLMYSFVFYSVTSKYLKILDPRISERCGRILQKARLLVHAPQFLAVFIFATGGTYWAAIGAYLTSLVFLYAAYFPKALEKKLRNLVADIDDAIDPKMTVSKQRLRYIHQYRVLGFVYRGWAALNFLLALFVLTYSFLPKAFLPTVPTDYHTIVVVISGSFAIVLCAVVFSTVGAARSYSKETDIRYFNAVDILNREFDSFSADGGSPGGDENLLSAEKFYSLEDDPTVAIDNPNNASRIVSGSGFFGVLRVFRAGSSAVFGLLLGIAVGSPEFGLATFCALAFSFGFNDLVDFRSGKDDVCHPDRPLPCGVVSERIVLVVLTVLVATLGASVFQLTANFSAPIVLFFGGILYSRWLKRLIPVVATPFWCALLAFSIFSALGLRPIEGVSVWLLILARELVFDLRDKDADFQFNKRKNIAMLLSPNQWIWTTLSVICAVLILWSVDSGIAYYYVLATGIILIQFARIAFERAPSKSAARAFSVLSHVLWPLAFLNAI